MRIYYSELSLIGGRVEENVDRLIEAGADHIELMLDGAGWNGFHLRKSELAHVLRTRGVGYSVHVPVWDANLTSENAQIREAVLETYRQTLAFAAQLGAGQVVVHPGFCSDPHFDKAAARARARQALGELSDYNRDYCRRILVENVGYSTTSIFTEAEFSSFLDGLPSDIGYIVDVGHAHLNGWDFKALLPALGERLYALHLHDNGGLKDSHSPIGEGSIDWGALVEAITGTGRDLDLVLEYGIGTDLARLAEGRAFLEASFPAALARMAV